MKYKINYSGKSLLELKEKYGIKATGFYDQSWYDNEVFAKEKPPKGKYEIILDQTVVNKTYQEQVNTLTENFTPIHPAILAETLLTKKNIPTGIYFRTGTLDSDGDRVDLGRSDVGVSVYYWDDDARDSDLGLAAARSSLKSGILEPIESFLLEKRIEKLENFVNKFTTLVMELNENTNGQKNIS